ncbi:protein translocase subunit SecD [Risungbinella massiliensis]|uniref:protein translocase subunit SecD n=1 Tax=Risungbinella massiliensis TaxID=1329796 RepID=UPI00069C9CBA|nr:protein translocase subunit SecD [Risungbinella massiliensis]
MKRKKGRIVLFMVLVVALLATVASTTMPVWNGIPKGLDLQGGFEVLYQAEAGQKVSAVTLKDAAASIQRRIDVLGVNEPEITVEEPNRIRVQLAGVQDPKKAREILGKPANLTFRTPDGKTVLIDGKDLVQGASKVEYDQFNQPQVAVKFKDPKKFEDITRQYIGQTIPIYLDEDQLSNPTISSVIPGGNAVITGVGTVDEAQQLADLLNAGALPIKLKEIQSFAVDASLGAESLQLSLQAGAYAILAIFIFMIGYYRIPGLVTVITLVAYGWLVLLTFYAFNMTLTLPGIAAFILGIGMAVDANVIMNERIREELRNGRNVKAAVKHGSTRSFGTITDANLTTILGGVVLFIFGTAGVKGFSVSLIAGILVSFVTAVGFARLLIYLLVSSNYLKKPSAFQVKGDEIGEL